MRARATALALTLMFGVASTAAASSITINTNPGTTYTTGGIVDFSTTSSQMNGMQITAFWTVNGGAQVSQTAIWNSGVSFGGDGFDLNISGDTFVTDAWELDFGIAGTGRLQSLVFNGVPGHTVFDRTAPSFGTPGSNQGKDFAGFGPYCDFSIFVCLNEGDIIATYFNQVVVGNNPFAGDIYAGIKIDFVSSGGLNEDSNWHFSLDTDIATSDLLNPVDVAAVPEPGTLVLLGTGLLGLASAARRRIRRA